MLDDIFTGENATATASAGVWNSTVSQQNCDWPLDIKTTGIYTIGKSRTAGNELLLFHNMTRIERR